MDTSFFPVYSFQKNSHFTVAVHSAFKAELEQCTSMNVTTKSCNNTVTVGLCYFLSTRHSAEETIQNDKLFLMFEGTKLGLFITLCPCIYM